MPHLSQGTLRRLRRTNLPSCRGQLKVRCNPRTFYRQTLVGMHSFSLHERAQGRRRSPVAAVDASRDVSGRLREAPLVTQIVPWTLSRRRGCTFVEIRLPISTEKKFQVVGNYSGDSSRNGCYKGVAERLLIYCKVTNHSRFIVRRTNDSFVDGLRSERLPSRKTRYVGPRKIVEELHVAAKIFFILFFFNLTGGFDCRLH